MSSRNSVQRAFDAFGKAHFQAKQSGSWQRTANGVEQSFGLQKSQHGLRYYLNLKFDFTNAVPADLAQDDGDLGYGFYFEGRVDGLLADTLVLRLRGLLDVDAVPLEEEHREYQLGAFLEENVPTALADLNTLDGISAYHRAGRLQRFLMTRSARRVLDALSSD